MNRRLVFTAYNRTDYFRQVMHSWSNVRGVTDWHPQVHLEPSDRQVPMLTTAGLVGARVHLNSVRMGVLHNPWLALDTAFLAGADFVVLAEDDVLVSTDTLEYFTWASEHLAGDDHVLAVCANSMQPECDPADEQIIHQSTAFNPLVWGTWADRWTGVLRDTWDHDYSSGTPDAPQSGWDWNINLRVMGHRHIVKPLASRSTHIGRYGGTHTTIFSFPGSVSPTWRADRAPADYVYVPAPAELSDR